jgi:hypothetical protein
MQSPQQATPPFPKTQALLKQRVLIAESRDGSHPSPVNHNSCCKSLLGTLKPRFFVILHSNRLMEGVAELIPRVGDGLNSDFVDEFLHDVGQGDFGGFEEAPSRKTLRVSA